MSNNNQDYVRPTNTRWNELKLWKNPLGAETRTKLIVDLVVGIVACAIIAHFSYGTFSQGGIEDAALEKFGVIFLAIASIVFVSKKVLNLRNYYRLGKAPLTLAYFPVLLGDKLVGQIDFQRKLPSGQAKLHLSCYRVRDDHSESPRKRQCVWEQTAYSPITQQSENSAVRIELNIPADLPESEEIKTEKVVWLLTVTLDTQPPFHREYRLPVYKGRRWPRSAQHENG